MRFLASLLALIFLGLLASAARQPQSGDKPVLMWRNLAGVQRSIPLEQAPGPQLQDWMGPWMEPQGLAALAPLTGGDTMVVQLAGGDRLHAKPLGGDGGNLSVRCMGSTDLTLSIDRVRSLTFPERQAGRGRLESAAEGDRLYRLAGRGLDRVDGVLMGFSPDGVRFDGRLGEKLYPWDEVVGLFIEALGEDPAGAALGTREAPVALVEWLDGSRIRGRLVEITPSAIVVTPMGDGGLAPWSIPMGAVGELVLLDGTFRFLSWQPVTDSGAARSPFDPPGSEPLGMVWPKRLDRAVSGGRLRAGGKVWTQGIGVHAPSRLQWKLAPEDCRFEFAVALDESAHEEGLPASAAGSVEFQVLVDGKLVWSSGTVTYSQGVVQPDGIDVRGAQVVELVVTDGGDGPVLDRANWLRPILIRCSESDTR